jgi:hypothetical protein
MDSTTALNWDAMVTGGPAGSLLGKRFLSSRKCGGTDEEEEDGCGSGDEGVQEVTTSRLGAAEIFNCPEGSRLHLATFKAETKHVLGLKKEDLKAWLLTCDPHPVAGPAPIFSTMTPTHLAYYEWTARRYGFMVHEYGLPAELQREKAKQIRELAIARGEEVSEAGAPLPKKAKVVTHADFLAKASKLCPSGVRAALPVSLEATPQFALPPWGKCTAPPAAEPVAPIVPTVVMPPALPYPPTAGANADQALSLSN